MAISNKTEKKDPLAEKDQCLSLLRQKAAAIGRLPKKADMPEGQAERITRSLGPWPRALEKAGLKPPREKTKRAAAKQRDLERLRQREAQMGLKAKSEEGGRVE